MQKTYFFRHYVEHRFEQGQAEELFHALEKKPFLADQATHLGSFRQGTEDLLSFALPLAIQSGQWNRFLRFTLVAYNTAGLAESLGSRSALRALVANGWPQLALDIAAQLPNHLARLQAFAAIAGSAEQSWRDKAVESLHGEVQNLRPPQDEESLLQLSLTFREVARELPSSDWPSGEQMPTVFADWPDLEDAVWQAAVEGCSQRGDWQDGQLWRFLDRIHDREQLRDALLPLIDKGEPGLSLADMADHLYVEKEEVFWPACMTFLSRQARESIEEALWQWNKILAYFTIPWSVELIESGLDLFGRIETSELVSLSATLPDDDTKATLWMSALAHRGDPERCANAFAAVRQIAGSSSLIWTLRLLRLDRVSSADEVRQRTEALRLRLFEAGYPFPARELASFLDLVAEVLPDRLTSEIENVAGRIPDLDILEEVASQVTGSAAVEELFERAEVLASRVVQEGEDELLSASRIVATLAARLCAQKGDLEALHSAAARLPITWHNELRALVAGELFRTENQSLARRALEDIRSPTVRLASLLELFPRDAGEDLRNPDRLYQSTTRIDAIVEEQTGIQALLEATADFGRSVEIVAQMTPGPTAVVAALRLGRRGAILQERGDRGAPDHLTLLHLVERILKTGSFARGPWLLPEIIEISARLNSAGIANEARNAAEELFAFSPDDGGGEVLERLVAHLQAVLPDDQLTRVLLALLVVLERLPVEARHAWTPEALPLLVTVAERLSGGPPRGLRKKIQSLAERSLREQPKAEDGLLAVRLCGADRSKRLQVGRKLCEAGDELPQTLRAAAYLLSSTDPCEAAALVGCAEPGANRDILCRRLVQYGWLPSAESHSLFEKIGDPDSKSIAEIFQALKDSEVGESDGVWPRVLGTCMARTGVDPTEPQFSPLVERLWQKVPDSTLTTLAHGVVDALQADTSLGEQAVRLWLHAYIAPKLDDPSSESLRRSEEVAQVFQQALTLAGPSRAHIETTDPKECQAAPEQLAQAFQRWRQASLESSVWEWKKQGSFTRTHAFLVIAILFILPDIELVLHGSLNWGWPLRLLAWYHTSPAWLFVLALFPINAVVLDRLQAGETPRLDLRRPWLLKLRFLLGGIPVLGLYTIPLWQWLLRVRPRWAFVPQNPNPLAALPVDVPSSFQPSRLRRLISSSWSPSPKALIGLWIVNLFVLRLATSRLSAAQFLTADRRQVLCMVLHQLGFLATGFTIIAQAVAWRLPWRDRLFTSALASTWLLAYPFPLAALCALTYPAVRRWGAGTLSAATQNARVPAEWAGLLHSLKKRAREIPWWRRPWGVETASRAGAIQRRLLTLCRVKSFLLFFDGALAFFLTWKIAHISLADGVAVLFLYFTGLFLVLLSGVWGLIFNLIDQGRRFVQTGQVLEDDGDPRPYGRALMINAGACVSGGILGYSIVTSNRTLFGWWLIWIGITGTFNVVQPAHRLWSVGPTFAQALRILVLRCLLFGSIGLLGAIAFKGGEPTKVIAFGFVILSFLAPAWSLISGFFLRDRLLSPFRARDILSSRLPWRWRGVLAFLLLTLVLPLGGLAIPLWIWAHHRLWPAWERERLPVRRGES